MIINLFDVYGLLALYGFYPANTDGRSANNPINSSSALRNPLGNEESPISEEDVR